MQPAAYGRIVLWEGGSLWAFEVPEATGAPGRTDFHAHHAIQVTLALDGDFKLHTAGGSIGGAAIVVAADVRHAFEPRGVIALLFVEPESPAGRRLSASLLTPEPVARVDSAALRALSAQALGAFRRSDRDALREIGRDMIRELAGDGGHSSGDPRVEWAIRWAAERLEGRLGIAEAAAAVGLSAGRMSHLFVEQTGLAFRTYLLWLRMGRAVERMAAGASLTEAAHDAGFADSAHFSRTFRRMFGVAAAALRLA